MKYAKSYLDKYFDTIEDYHSMVELFGIAYGDRVKIPDNRWFTELSEMMNWQAMSERSGVWTYYEVVNEKSSQVLVEGLKGKHEDEMLQKYLMGLGKFEDEKLMDEIDTWIQKNESKIYKYIEGILLENKSWFYQL